MFIPEPKFSRFCFSTRFEHHKVSIEIKTACISILVNKYPEQCAVYALLPIPANDNVQGGNNRLVH